MDGTCAPLPRLPALDGLRGLAVLGVVLFHAGGLLRGGYLGVDLFFVLSGFLITSNLLAELRRTARIDLAAFWVRRARRLFPALLALMPAVALYARFVAKPEELAELRADALWTLAYAANWRAIFSARDYWALFAASSPLEHTWSLAIEEQYYLVWPIVVLATARFGRAPRRLLAALTVTLLLASILASLALLREGRTSRIYFGTDTRAAAILVGALLATLRGREPSPRAECGRRLDAAGVVALALLAFAWCTLEGQDALLYRGGFWGTELACAVLVACAGSGEGSAVARSLAWAPLRWLGTRSYGIYLWHWPLWCALTSTMGDAPRWALLALDLVATFAVAEASYAIVESPIRSRGLATPHPFLVTSLAFAGAYAIVAAAAEPRAGTREPARAGRHVATEGTRPDRDANEADVHHFPPARTLPTETLRVLVLGDSVAMKLGAAMHRNQRGLAAWVAERGVGNCSIMETFTMDRFDPFAHPSPETGCAANWVRDAHELAPDVTFIAIGGGFLPIMTIAGRSVDACDEAWSAAYAGRLKQVFREMGPSAGRVVLMTAPSLVGRAAEVWKHPKLDARIACFNATIRRVAREWGAGLVDVAAHVCPDGVCILQNASEPIRPDGLHPDGPGADELARWTLASLLEAAQRPR